MIEGTEPKVFNPYERLIQLSSSHMSGLLKVNFGAAIWHIYLVNGDIQYADCATHTLVQLSHLLRRQGLERALPILKEVPPPAEMGYDRSNINQARDRIQQSLRWLDEMQALDTSQLKKLIEDLTQDTLESFLWLREGQSAWEDNVSSPVWVNTILGGGQSWRLLTPLNFYRRE